MSVSPSKTKTNTDPILLLVLHPLIVLEAHMLVFATSYFLPYPLLEMMSWKRQGQERRYPLVYRCEPHDASKERGSNETRKAGIRYNEKYVRWKVESWNWEILGKQ